MKMRQAAFLGLGAGLLGVMAAPRARADEWDKKTVMTFNEPVEVPGRVLPAGKYVFKLMDSQSNRDIVQIFNARESHLYATVMALPDYRTQVTGKTVLKLGESKAGAPPEIKEWFYPGDNYGQEFLYKRTAPVAVAMNAPAAPKPQPAPTPKQPKPLETAQAQPPAMPPAQAAPAPAPAQKPVMAQPQASRRVRQLPKTASDLPLAGLVGLLSLALAGVVRKLRKQLA